MIRNGTSCADDFACGRENHFPHIGATFRLIAAMAGNPAPARTGRTGTTTRRLS